MSAAITAWAIDALVASTLLMIAVLLARRPVRQAFGPQVAYALWALPVLRLALPPMPETWRTAAAMPVTSASETITILVIEPAAAVAATPALSFGAIAALIWGLGALTFLGWHLIAHAQFCRRMLATADRVEARGRVQVIHTPAAPGPLAFGIVRRYVAFPRDIAERYDADERALALAHEIGHHERGDLIANWIALVVLALHWFNLVAWRAFRTFRADQELANDARVLAGRSPVDRHIYACAIVKAAHGGAVSAACHLHTITDLKGRLRMLTTSRTSRRRLATGAASVAALVVAGLGLTASGTRAAATVSKSIETATGVDLQTPPVPQVPAAGNAKHVRRVVIVKDGKTNVYEGAEADRYVAANPVPIPPVLPVPQVGAVPTPPAISIPPVNVNVISANCGPDAGGKAYVIKRREGRAEATVICTDRIEAAARAGQLVTADQAGIQRQAMTGALEALRGARASMAANASIPTKDRNEAVAEIDSSIKELQGEIADIGKD